LVISEQSWADCRQALPLLIGQGLIAFIRSPLLRAGIAPVAIPAGIAGFQAAHALGSLATEAAYCWRPWLSLLGDIPLGMAKRDDVGA
jgi:hypothetical protein